MYNSENKTAKNIRINRVRGNRFFLFRFYCVAFFIQIRDTVVIIDILCVADCISDSME